MRIATVGGVLVLLVAASALFLTYSRLGRAVFGVATVTIANGSGSAISDVELSLAPAGAQPFKRQFSSIRPGDSRTIRVRTSDLVVDGLVFVIDGTQYSYTEGGIACPGEQFVLKVGNAGNVTSDYAR